MASTITKTSPHIPSILPTRQLGRNGPMVPRLGLGLMGGAAGTYGKSKVGTEAERLAFLGAAFERGETFWDTADKYGDSEELIGKYFALNPSHRQSIFLATKFGIKTPASGRGFSIDSTPEYCLESIDRSLARLGLPYVDLYYIHRLDKVTPIEKTMQAMAALVAAGKIRYVGLSECSADSLRRAHAVHPVTAVQVEYSVFCTQIESEQTKLLATARELGVAVVAYSPLGNGFLTGSLRRRSDFTADGDTRAAIPWLSEDNLSKNVTLIDKIAEIAARKNLTLAQLALAWLMAQGDDIFAIPGTSKIHRLEENLSSLEATLSPEEEREVRVLGSQVTGGRFQAKTGFDFANTPPF